MKKVLLALLLMLSSTFGIAASNSNPALYYGQIPTAAQWNGYFSGKLDYNAGAQNAVPYWDNSGNLLSALISGDCTSVANVFTCAATIERAVTLLTTSTSGNSTYYPLFVSTTANSNQVPYLNSSLNYNPATGTLSATNFIGTINGNTLTTGSSTYTGTAAQTYIFPSTSQNILGNASNSVVLNNIAQVATNTVLGNSTGGTANITAMSVGGCSSASSALTWTTNTGFSCNTSITANTSTTSTNLAGGNNTTLLGSIPYQSNTNVTTLLSPNTTAVKWFLSQTGTGSNGAVPAWGLLVSGDIPSNAANTSGTATNATNVTGSGTVSATTTGGAALTPTLAATATVLANVAGGLTSNTTINDTTSYTTGGITLASQTAVAGSVWRIHALGTFVAVSSATTRNAEVAVFWGATQLTPAFAPAVLISTVQTTDWTVDFILNASSTTAVWTTGQMGTDVASVTVGYWVVNNVTPASTTVSSGAQTIDLRFAMSTAVATDQWVVQQVTMERIK